MEAKRTKDALTEEIERLTDDKKKISRERLEAVKPVDEKLRLVEDQLKDLRSELKQLNVSERAEHGFHDEMRQLRDEVERLRKLLVQATEDSRRNKSEKDDACSERDCLRLKLETAGKHLPNDVKTEHRKRLENTNDDVVQLRKKGEQNELMRKELKTLAGKCSEMEGDVSTARSEAAQSKKEADELRLAWRKAVEELELMRSISEMTQRRQLEQSEIFHEISAKLKELILVEKPSNENSWSSSNITNDKTVDSDHVLLMKKLYDSLCQRIVALPIAARMFQRGALTLKELESIQSKHECPARGAEMLLNFLLKQPYEVYECFLEALKLSQHHVYTWLVNSGCAEFAPDAAHTLTIQKHYIFLLERMEAKHSLLVDKLRASGVLSESERDDIKAGKTQIRRNEKLLSVLSRKSAEQWELFLDALDSTQQSHIRYTVTGVLPVAAPVDQNIYVEHSSNTDSPTVNSVKSTKILYLEKATPEPRNFCRNPPSLTENTSVGRVVVHVQDRREQPVRTAWPPVKAVFGLPLGSCHMSHTHRLVPLVVERCARVVEERGLEDQGIYRVSGNSGLINMMVDELDKDPVNLCPDNDKWQNVYVASGLLKLFFRALPDSLMTDELYTTVIQVNQTKNSKQRMLKLKKVLRDLPEINFETFRFLAQHLSKVASKREINKMDAWTLAIIFGPLLIRPMMEAEETTTAMQRDQSDGCRVVKSIILHYEWFFSASDEHLDVPVDEQPK